MKENDHLEAMKVFIDRCKNDDIQKQVDEHYREYVLKCNQWHRKNPEKAKESFRKYLSTEKGLKAHKKSREKRKKIIKELIVELSWNDKCKIHEFYKNCPKGYCVDHIMPISRGGKHTLSNLQYLTYAENAQKADMTNEEWENYKLLILKIDSF